MKKRVIFTSYDDLIIKKLSHVDSAKSKMVKEYLDKLVKNKKDYAKAIGADFIFYHNEMKDYTYHNLKQSEFTKVNLYKHDLMANLTDDYDEILYVDMDVVFNTNLNIFDEHDLSQGIHIADMNKDISDKDKSSLLFSNLGLRSSTLKYHITKDLLDGQDNNVINTGIILGQSNHIKQIKFTDRVREAVEKIEKLKNNKEDVFEQQYYPNNESIFSYILEKYDVPYVLLTEKWHQIIDETARDIDGYCLHFINKQFNAFYKTKSQCIFSIHIEIPDDKLDNPKGYSGLEISKSQMVKNQFIKYSHSLLENHSNYADSINADYFHYGRDAKYEKFKTRFPDLSDYDVINLYKIFLLDELTKKYDHVLYVDFDVYFKDSYSIFDFLPLDYLLCCKYTFKGDILIPKKNISLYFKTYDRDFRNPNTKYWNTHAMLVEEGLDGDNDVFNTGIVLASKYTMEKLDYFSDIEDTIALMKYLKEDEYSLYSGGLQSQFGYDNETIFSYKIKNNSVPYYNLEDAWHYTSMLDHGDALTPGTRYWDMAKAKYDAECKEKNVSIVHFISKNFALELGT